MGCHRISRSTLFAKGIHFMIFMFRKGLHVKRVTCEKGYMMTKHILKPDTLPVNMLSIWVSTGGNPSSGFPKKGDSNQSAQLQRLARKLKFGCRNFKCDTFQKANKKALNSLHECADWSAPLLFAYSRRQVFSVKAHIQPNKGFAFLNFFIPCFFFK